MNGPMELRPRSDSPPMEAPQAPPPRYEDSGKDRLLLEGLPPSKASVVDPVAVVGSRPSYKSWAIILGITSAVIFSPVILAAGATSLVGTIIDKGLTSASQGLAKEAAAEGKSQHTKAEARFARGLEMLSLVPKGFVALIGYPTFYAAKGIGKLIDYGFDQKDNKIGERFLNTPLTGFFTGPAKRMELMMILSKKQENPQELTKHLMSILEKYGGLNESMIGVSPQSVMTILDSLDAKIAHSNALGENTTKLSEAREKFREDVKGLLLENSASVLKSYFEEQAYDPLIAVDNSNFFEKFPELDEFRPYQFDVTV